MASLSIAILLPEEIKQQLQRLCFGLQDVLWIETEELHLTLASIGSIDDNTRLDIIERLQTIQLPSFPLKLTGFESFVSKGAKGSLRLLVDDSLQLNTLKKLIDSILHDIHMPTPEKKIVPHVTLAYYERLDKKRFYTYLEAYSHFISNPFTATTFALLESHWTQKRKIFTIHSTYSLLT